MRLTTFLVGLVAVTSIVVTPALACKGKKVIFEDSFDEADSGWGEVDNNDEMMISGGKFTVKPKPNTVKFPSYSASLFDDVDMCITTKMAKNTNNDAMGALTFWRTPGTSDMFMVGYFASGNASVQRRQKNNWLTLKDFPGLVNAQESNSIRITLKGNSLTAYINDKQLGTFKGINVADGSMIGVAAQHGEWEFSKLKVTTVPPN